MEERLTMTTTVTPSRDERKISPCPTGSLSLFLFSDVDIYLCTHMIHVDMSMSVWLAIGLERRMAEDHTERFLAVYAWENKRKNETSKRKTRLDFLLFLEEDRKRKKRRARRVCSSIAVTEWKRRRFGLCSARPQAVDTSSHRRTHVPTRPATHVHAAVHKCRHSSSRHMQTPTNAAFL